jgi:SAM-dependent methyltransferase
MSHLLFWNGGVKKEKKRDKNWEKRIHTDLVWLEIEPFLRPGLKVLDAGGGFGRYSIPLAERGCQVTHFDLSPRMVKEAAKIARERGISSIEFEIGKVQDLSRFPDYAFDLVISLDAPISYAYPEEKKALRELGRVTKDKLIVSVVNRWGQIPVAVEEELRFRNNLEISRRFFREGNWDHPSFWENLEKKVPLLYRFVFPPLHAFTPSEIIDDLIEEGFRPLRVVASGTLARLLPRRTLKKIVNSPSLYKEFLELSREYDALFEVLGVGAKVASGLLVVGERKNHSEEMV